MKTILTGILSLFIFFGAVPTANASDMNMAGMEEVKKKKKKGKKLAEKGKKKKKGFFSKVFGSKQKGTNEKHIQNITLNLYA